MGMLQRSKPPTRSRRTAAQPRVEAAFALVEASAPAEAMAPEAPAPERPVAETVPAAPATPEIAEAAGTAAATAPQAIPAPLPPGIGSGPQSPQPRAPGALTVMEIPMQQANKAAETMMKAAEEAAEFGRGNVEAMTKATQIYVAGVQDLGRQTFAIMQGLTDHALAGAKALSGVKSLHEAAQIQSNFARAAIEKSVAESAKLGEAALKLTEEAMAPITARMTLASEKAFRPSLAA